MVPCCPVDLADSWSTGPTDCGKQSANNDNKTAVPEDTDVLRHGYFLDFQFVEDVQNSSRCTIGVMLGIALPIIPVSFEILINANPSLVTMEGISVGFINTIGIFRIKCFVGSVICLSAAIIARSFYTSTSFLIHHILVGLA